MLRLANPLSEVVGRDFGSASDNLPSEGEPLALRTPNLLISFAAFTSLGRSASQFGHRCSRSARLLGNQVRHWWQNWLVPHGSTNTMCFPRRWALRTHFPANLLHAESEIAFAKLRFLTIPAKFSLSKMRMSACWNSSSMSLFCQSSR